MAKACFQKQAIPELSSGGAGSNWVGEGGGRERAGREIIQAACVDLGEEGSTDSAGLGRKPVPLQQGGSCARQLVKSESEV